MKHKRNFARVFGQDLMRGEHVVGGGKVKASETSDLRGGLTHRTTKDPFRAKKKKNKAIPGGGGYGKNSAYMFKTPNGYRSQKEIQARAIGTQGWVQKKIDEGDIAGGMASEQSGTSIFDPVLCELAYRWFCPPGGLVLDPFAGGSVRGIVAAKLGRKYIGVDLRSEQVAANEKQARAILGKTDPKPKWIEGDSRDLHKLAKGTEADFVFSCPPYADLEVYSDDPRDLSTFEYSDFREAMDAIIAKSVAMLKPDRFACFVVGDARGPDGFYYGFPWHVIDGFERAGARLYNEAALVTAVGSLPIRARKQFNASRKLGKTHQNVLVFCKGSAEAATKAIGAVEFGVALPEAPAGMAGVSEL